MLKKGDIVLVSLIILVVIIWFAAANIFKSETSDSIAVIKQNDKILKTIDLDKLQGVERITLLGNYHGVVLAEKGRIRFEESNCPDKVCVKSGWLTKKGDVAVCIPNKAIIKIEGINKKIDGVTY